MRKRFDDEVAEVMAILDRPDPHANRRGAEAALNMALASGDGPLRRRYLAKAQKFIARMDHGREAEEIQELQGHVLALQGRGGDTRIAHVTRGEQVIPTALQTPEVMTALARAAKQAGLDPRRFQVGQGRINPRTGHEEFADSPEHSQMGPDGLETVTSEAHIEPSDRVYVQPHLKPQSLPGNRSDDIDASDTAPRYMFSCPPRPQLTIDGLERQARGLQRETLTTADKWSSTPDSDPNKHSFNDMRSRLNGLAEEEGHIRNAINSYAARCLPRRI